MSATPRPRPRRTGLIVAGTLLSILVVAVLVGLSDLGDLRARAAGTRWEWTGIAALLAVFSYACIARAQLALFRLLGVRLPGWFYLRASMASVVVARTLRSGGTSGLAFLALLLARRGVPVVATLSMGLGNVLVNACVATLFVLAGVLVLMTHPEDATRAASWGYGIGAALLVSGLVASWAVLTRDGIRHALLKRLSAAAARLGKRLRREGWGERVLEQGERASGAARALVRHPGRAWRAWAWASLRLTASVLSLGACARAVGHELGAPELLLAFTAMKMAGSVAFVPAGLGIVDGSLAGMLTLLGLPYEAALLVAALHRGAYHVVPALVSLALAGPLLTELARAPREAGQPERDGASPVSGPDPGDEGGSSSRSS